MVCTAKDLQEWKDFPKGLSVLLLEEDATSASLIRSKLLAMDYTVSVFANEVEALSVFSSKPESFHLAIVEVNENNGDRTFKFLESAKELPIIMTSNVHCISTMMKCIALGAVEFLPKPLSQEKLKNIWQHVVHKAYNTGGPAIKKPDITVQEEPHEGMAVPTEHLSESFERDEERSSGTDKYPAPSTPQLKQGERLLDNRDCQEQTNCSTEKDSVEQDGESKSVETTCRDSVAAVTDVTDQPETAATSTIKDEGDTSSVRRSDDPSSPQQCEVPTKSGNDGVEKGGKATSLANSSLSKSNRKKVKIDWTPELHRKFVHAVEQLGVDQAIPSRILELMKVEGLTRYNVASHLQKYRMHKRHILPKEIDRTLSRPRELMSRNCYAQRPVMAFPTYHSNHSVHAGPVYPMWGHPGGMWTPPAYPLWQPAENWHWQPYPGVHADAWGCPVMPPPHTSYNQPQSGHGIFNVAQNTFDLHPAEEVIDKAVKEAISKPWLPLPLGLKPPSTDTVLSELSRQGISPLPPHHRDGRSRFTA